MKLDNIALPYPILSTGDDILPSLTPECVNVEMKEDRLAYHFTVDLDCNNWKIRWLVTEGFAIYTCEYECAKTMLRRCEKSKDPHFEIDIPRTSVAGRIYFSCFATVVKPIQNYRNTGFNEDYQNMSFEMEAGDILAAFPSFHYDADIQYDKLLATGSFMQVRENKQRDDVFFDITGDKIEIELPSALYGAFCQSGVRDEAQIIHSSLVFNALTYALLQIKNNEETKWARTIAYRMETEDDFKGIGGIENIDNVNVLSIAQKLLKDPYKRMFDYIKARNNAVEEE